MIIDSSAMIAILFGESDAERYLSVLLEAERVRMSATTVVETAVVALKRAGVQAEGKFDLLLAKGGVETVPVTPDQVVIARNAYRTFGKGRHPAQLNLGDCFSYALAKAYMEPLLFKGNDFARTDIASAL